MSELTSQRTRSVEVVVEVTVASTSREKIVGRGWDDDVRLSAVGRVLLLRLQATNKWLAKLRSLLAGD